MKFILAFIAAVSVSSASAQTTCKLSSTYKYSNPDDVDELLIRKGTFRTEAILITSFGAKIFECVDAIIDVYECYGFANKPHETPTQLNIAGAGLQAGAIVVHTALNLGFTRKYAADDYKPVDYELRRFSIDTYEVASCVTD